MHYAANRNLAKYYPCIVTRQSSVAMEKPSGYDARYVM